MNFIRTSHRIVLAAMLTALSAAGMSAYAQAVPKLLRVVVPYAPGGGTDILGRQLAEGVAAELGATVIVENKAGGSGNIGAQAVTRSPADGSTLLLGDLALAVNPSLFKKLPFDPKNDLQPIAMVANAPLVLVVHSQSGITSVDGLVASAKANPGRSTFASAGNGNPPHLAGELFKVTTQTNLEHVAYKGVGPALNDLLGGHVTMMFTGISSTKQHIDSGVLTALAVTGGQRATTLPNVPTMAEVGYPEAGVTSWWGLFAPAGTPKPVIDAISQATERALKNPSLRDKLDKQNIIPTFGGPEVLGAKLANETDRWAKVIRSANITVN
jgi:tripartite-type tricarboxylate transporter receptor subunit TctC